MLIESTTAFLEEHSSVCFPIPLKDKVTVLIPLMASPTVLWSLIVVASITSAKYVASVESPPTTF
jgi:hypothetical protein